MSGPTTRFSQRASAYAKYRPGYPPSVFEALFQGLGDPSKLVVADAGAGTGISSALLAQRVARVIAVEPNVEMRERADPWPNVEWRGGTAERTGLPDRSVDVAAAFQAFHWFDLEAAFAEFMRIARRRIALIQYERDEREAFARAYGDLVRRYATDDTEALRLRTLDGFARLAGSRLSRVDLASAQRLDAQALLGRLASASYLPDAGSSARLLRSDMLALFERFSRDGTVELAMTVHVLAMDV